MKRKQPNTYGGQGFLPSPAPLAVPYVPFQPENAAQYEPQKALVRGTLYSGLDLPFMGMVNRKNLPVSPMSQLQTIDFAIQELALYLDTHVDDQEALELYHKYQQLYSKAESEYTKSHRPLTHKDDTNSLQYAWVSDPWPWEYSSNKEK